MISSQTIPVLQKLLKTSGLLYNGYYDVFEFLTVNGWTTVGAGGIRMCEEFQMTAKHDDT